MGSLLSLGLLVVPLLVLGTGATLTSAAPGGAGGGRTAASASTRPRDRWHRGPEARLPAAPTTDHRPCPDHHHGPAPDHDHDHDPPPTTTTTRPSGLPPTTVSTTINDTATGIATWYSEAPPGRCASPWLAFGTTVYDHRRRHRGLHHLLVDDREAQNPGRVIDLSPSGFEAMAPLSQGVIQVNISW